MGMSETELENHDGEMHCPVHGCDYWVPEGMEYMYPDHRAEHDSVLPAVYFDAKRWAGWQVTRLKLWRDGF